MILHAAFLIIVLLFLTMKIIKSGAGTFTYKKKIQTYSFFLLQNFSKNVKIQTTNITNKSRRSVFRPRHSSIYYLTAVKISYDVVMRS